MAYQGSTEAGQAVADVIFGKIDPSGKLPVTWPSDAAAPGGDFNTGAPSPLGRSAEGLRPAPLHRLGPGQRLQPALPVCLRAVLHHLRCHRAVRDEAAWSRAGTVTAAFTVSNTGSRAGTDIVPVYVHQPVSLVVVPDQRLVGVHPGDAGSRAVQDRAGLLPGLGTGRHARRHRAAPPSPQVELGPYQVQIGTPASAQCRLHRPQLSPPG